jgi:hypothetical protein
VRGCSAPSHAPLSQASPLILITSPCFFVYLLALEPELLLRNVLFASEVGTNTRAVFWIRIQGTGLSIRIWILNPDQAGQMPPENEEKLKKFMLRRVFWSLNSGHPFRI